MKTDCLRLRLYLLLAVLLIGITGQAQVTVWPGDANNNGIANHVDILYLGLGQNIPGPPRNTPSTAWAPVQAPLWPQVSPNGANYAHLDCNGDGVINFNDFSVVETNFNEVTGGGIVPDSSFTVLGGAPNLSLNINPDTLVVNGSTVVSMDISLGNPAQGVDSIYGLAFTIDFDTTVVDSIVWNLPGGFINSDSTSYSTAQVDYQNGKIEMAITRTNQMNAAGAGIIGSIGIVMDDNIRVSSNFNLLFDLSFVFAVTASALPVPLRITNDSLLVLTNRQEVLPPATFQVYPNPFASSFILQGQVPIQSARLYDLQGRLVWTQEASNQIRIQVSPGQLSPGPYFLEVYTQEGIGRKKLLVAPSMR